MVLTELAMDWRKRRIEQARREAFKQGAKELEVEQAKWDDADKRGDAQGERPTADSIDYR